MRSLWHARVTFVVIVLTMGVTASLALIASRIAVSTFLRPLPYDQSGALVVIEDQTVAEQLQQAPAKAAGPYRSFAASARLHTGQATAVTSTGSAFRATVTQVSEDFFRLVEMRPMAGGLLTGHSRAAPIAIITDAAARRYALPPDPLGERLSVNGHALTIVGVVPAAGAFPAATDLWVPQGALGTNVFRGTVVYLDIARLSTGVSETMAEQELRDALGPKPEPRVRSLRQSLTAASSPSVMALLGASLAVLLAAGVNLCHLLLARVEQRRSMFAISAALGGTGATILKIIAIEQAVLCGVGALVAFVSSYWWLAALSELLPPTTLGLDGRLADWRFVLGLLTLFGVVAAVLTGVLYLSVSAARKDGSLAALETRGIGRPKGGRWLIASEVAAAAAVAALAAVLVGSVAVALGRGHEGIRANVYVVDIELPDAKSPDAARYFMAILERLRVSAQFRSLAVANSAPFTEAPMFALRFNPTTGTPTDVTAEFRVVSDGYLETLGIPLLAGRGCTSHDLRDGRKVAIVSSDVAERLWHTRNAVGQRLRIAGAPAEFTYDVVGVVQPTRHRDLVEDRTDAAVYGCFSQQSPPYMTLLAASDTSRAEAIAAILAGIRDVDPTIAPGAIRTIEEARRRSIAGPIASATLAAVLAIQALALCALGIYAILTLDTRARAREIAVRLVCGATRLQVLVDLVRPVVAVALLGGAVGTIAAACLIGAMRSLTPGRVLEGPIALPIAGTAALVILFAVTVAFWGIRRASGVEPSELLKTRL